MIRYNNYAHRLMCPLALIGGAPFLIVGNEHRDSWLIKIEVMRKGVMFTLNGTAISCSPFTKTQKTSWTLSRNIVRTTGCE